MTLKGVSTVQCNKMYKRFNLTFKLNQFCAGGEEGFDSCQGNNFDLICILFSSADDISFQEIADHR